MKKIKIRKYNKPILLYPGSLIQQSINETADHGIIKWDVKDCSPEFIKINNDQEHHRILIENGKLPNINNLPQRGRITLTVKDTEESDIIKIKSVLKNKYPLLKRIDIVKEHDLKINGKSSISLKLGNIRDVNYQNELIKDFLKRKHKKITNDTINRILSINVESNNDLPKSDVIRNSIWDVESFEFSNMFSYGENNIIDFSKFTDTIGIFGPNTIGKSSILDAITYAIFDKAPRTNKAINVMNNKKDNFKLKLKFSIDNEKYFIERIGTRNKNGNVSVKVNFGSSLLSLNGDQRSSTNNNIRQYLGTYDNFVLTALSLQDKNNSIVDMKQSDRKQLLSYFLDIIIFENLTEITQKRIKELQIKFEAFSDKNFEDEINSSELKIKEYEEKYEKALLLRKKIEDKLNEINNEIIELNKKIIEIDCEKIDVNILEKNINEIKDEIKTKKFSIEKNNRFIEKQENILKTLEKNIKTNQSIENDYKKYEDNEKEYVKLKNEKEIFERFYNDKFTKLKKYNKIEYDENCKYCLKFVDSIVKMKNELKNDKNKINKHKKQIEKAEKILNNNQSIIPKYEKYKKSLNDKTKLLMDIKFNENENLKNISDLNIFKDKLSKNQERIDKFYKNKDNIESNKKIENEIDKIKEKEKLAKDYFNQVEEYYISTKSTLEIEKNKKKNLLKELENLKNIEKELQYYKYYIEAINKNGIPQELISRSIPIIEDETNNILSQIVDFKVKLEVDGKDINIYIVYNDIDTWPIELISGFERFASSIGIRVALLNATSLPKPNFFMIDEGFGTLDPENLNNLQSLFSYLKTKFKFILIISHIDTIRDFVENIVEIKKDNNFSYISY